MRVRPRWLVAGGVTVALTGAVSVAALAAPDTSSGGGKAATQPAGPPAPLDPLGAGTRLFSESDKDTTRLKLVEHAVYSNGIQKQVFDVVR